MKLITNISNIALLNLCLVLAKPTEDILSDDQLATTFSDAHAETEGAISEIPIEADESLYNFRAIDDDDSYEDARFVIDADFVPIWMQNNGTMPVNGTQVHAPRSKGKTGGVERNLCNEPILSRDYLGNFCDGTKSGIKCLKVTDRKKSNDIVLKGLGDGHYYRTLEFTTDTRHWDKFELIYRDCIDGKNYYSIHPKGSSEAFDVYRHITTDNNAIVIHPYHGRKNQLFGVRTFSGGVYKIYSAIESDYVLDRHLQFDRLTGFPHHGGQNQQFAKVQDVDLSVAQLHK